MLQEKEESIIRSYARSGMRLDVLIKSFPQFTKEDVIYAYKEEYGMIPSCSSLVIPSKI